MECNGVCDRWHKMKTMTWIWWNCLVSHLHAVFCLQKEKEKNRKSNVLWQVVLACVCPHTGSNWASFTPQLTAGLSLFTGRPTSDWVTVCEICRPHICYSVCPQDVHEKQLRRQLEAWLEKNISLPLLYRILVQWKHECVNVSCFYDGLPGNWEETCLITWRLKGRPHDACTATAVLMECDRGTVLHIYRTGKKTLQLHSWKSHFSGGFLYSLAIIWIIQKEEQKYI